ncbi:MAG: HNH endonuclease [Proteobacteria bacterium]|nr:HNH endonuclease [Pseudomonadota bacterium]
MKEATDKIFGEIQPFNPKKVTFPSIGKCIYCDASNVTLTDEHIIPLSMGGVQIMEKASCEACCKIINKFETKFAKEIFGTFREKHRFPSRHRKNRQNEIEVTKVNGDKFVVPLSEFPAPTYMIKMATAGILNGMPPSVDTSFLWQFVVITNDKELDDFTKKYGQDVTYKLRFLIKEFAQTMAKIGHAYVMANFGNIEFEKLSTDLILGKTENPSLSYVVGGSWEILPPIPNAGHIWGIRVLLTNPDTLLIIADIRLMAASSTPNYHVVVGRTRDKNAIQKIIQICRDSELNSTA